MKYLLRFIKKKDIPYILAVILIGSLSHFLYEFSGGAALFALLCPVNESTWEHLKLLFFPYLTAVIWMWLRRRPSPLPFFYYHYLGAACGMLSIVILFYTYTGVVGRHFLIVDILIFVIGVILAFYTSSVFCRKRYTVPSQSVIFSLWIVTALCFFAFTCYPPNLGLFYPAP